MKAFNLISSELQQEYEVRLIGHVSPEMKNELLACVTGSLRGKIIFKGDATFAELCAAYKNASLFVLPSLVEAFGLPIVEAMAAGVPVLVSNTTALPEIAGKAGLTFDPYDPADLAGKMEQVLLEDKLAKRMVELGLERAKMFIWENTVKQTLQCIDKLLHNEN